MKMNAIPSLVATLPLLLGVATPLLLSGCGKSGDTASAPASAPAPFTGQVHEVKMRGTADAYFYEPAMLVIKGGDKVRFVMVDGAPHNVNFTGQRIPSGAGPILEKDGKLLGALLQAPGQATEIEFTKDMPKGEYNYVCDPHAGLGMKGKIVVNF